MSFRRARGRSAARRVGGRSRPLPRPRRDAGAVQLPTRSSRTPSPSRCGWGANAYGPGQEHDDAIQVKRGDRHFRPEPAVREQEVDCDALGEHRGQQRDRRDRARVNPCDRCTPLRAMGVDRAAARREGSRAISPTVARRAIGCINRSSNASRRSRPSSLEPTSAMPTTNAASSTAATAPSATPSPRPGGPLAAEETRRLRRTSGRRWGSPSGLLRVGGLRDSLSQDLARGFEALDEKCSSAATTAILVG